MQWFDQILKSSNAAIELNGNLHYTPFNPYTSLWPLYSKEWLDWLYVAFEKSKQKNSTNRELAFGFLGPQIIRKTLVDVAFMSKACSYDKKKTEQLLTWLKDILLEKCTGDPFGFESNQVLSKEDLKYLMQMFPFHPPVEGEAQAAMQLVKNCEALTQVNFLWNTQEWLDTYGPYTLPSGRKIMLHAFTNFEPVEIFPHAAGFDPSTIYIYSIHDNAEIKVDYYGRTNNKSPLAETMTSLLIFEHGRLVKDQTRIIQLNALLQEEAQKQAMRMQALDAEQLKEKEVELHCYMYRELFKLLELDWKPTQEMKNAVKDKALLKFETPAFENEKEKREYWSKILNPNEDFFPKELKVN